MSSECRTYGRKQRMQSLYNTRRLIGRRFDDSTVKKDIESWPFKVIDQGGNPMVQVEYLGETKQFSPQEISSMVLGKVRVVHTRISCAAC